MINPRFWRLFVVKILPNDTHHMKKNLPLVIHELSKYIAKEKDSYLLSTRQGAP